MKFAGRIVMAVATALLVIPTPAAAYLDPSTGSIVLQVMVGGLLAALAALRFYWSKIRSWFGKKGAPPSSS